MCDLIYKLLFNTSSRPFQCEVRYLNVFFFLMQKYLSICFNAPIFVSVIKPGRLERVSVVERYSRHIGRWFRNARAERQRRFGRKWMGHRAKYRQAMHLASREYRFSNAGRISRVIFKEASEGGERANTTFLLHNTHLITSMLTFEHHQGNIFQKSDQNQFHRWKRDVIFFSRRVIKT